MNLSPDRLLNMFITLFIRRIMMSGINWIIRSGMSLGRRATQGRARREVRGEETPRLNDFSNRD